MTWRSKAPPQGGAAHFIHAGAPLCASVVLRDGTPRLAPFLCTWIERNEHDHLCSICRREVRRLTGDATLCRCGICSIKIVARVTR